MKHKIGVVIPCYKVSAQILSVLNDIGPEVDLIVVVDDYCPEKTGMLVERKTSDTRIVVVKHSENLGVGAAVITGYKLALDQNIDVIVKVDGDGQMDPSLINNFVIPIITGRADYTKGNRFFNIDGLTSMPRMRLIGNTLLSFVTKISSGYWDIFDPTNGYTAIRSTVARQLPFEKISKRFFFESDILFRLNTFRAVVRDVPIFATYGEEVSNLRITSIFGVFFRKNIVNTFKRVFYTYYLRDLTIASIQLPIGLLLFVFGMTFGIHSWVELHGAAFASSGTVMLSALPILTGIQLILSFINYDIEHVPKHSMYNHTKK